MVPVIARLFLQISTQNLGKFCKSFIFSSRPGLSLVTDLFPPSQPPCKPIAVNYFRLLQQSSRELKIFWKLLILTYLSSLVGCWTSGKTMQHVWLGDFQNWYFILHYHQRECCFGHPWIPWSLICSDNFYWFGHDFPF